MKKIISIFSLLLLICLLSACFKETKPTEISIPKEAKIDKTVPEEGASLVLLDKDGVEGEWAQYVAERFTEQYGIPVTFLQSTASFTLKKTNVDVFSANHEQTSSLKKANLIQRSFYEKELNDTFIPVSLSSVSIDEKIYGYPFSVETSAIFYNKELVKTVPTTFDDLLLDAKNFTSKKERMFGLMMDPDNLYYQYAFFSANNASLFKKPTKAIVSDSSIKTGTLLRSIQRDILPLANEELNINDNFLLFSKGTVKYVIAGSWEYEKYINSGVNVGVIPFPITKDGVIPKTLSSTKAYFINRDTKYPNAAHLFAKFSTSDAMLLKRFELTGELPPKKGIVLNNENVDMLLEQADSSISLPSSKTALPLWSPLNEALSDIWNSEEKVGTILEKAASDIKKN